MTTPWGFRRILEVIDKGISFQESSTVPSGAPASGFGTVWLRDDSPNVLMFTDDGGTDHVLVTSGSSASSGIPGNIYEDLLFYMDPADRNSYPGSGTSVTDLMGNATGGTVTNATFEDGAFNFDASGDDISFTKPAALDNIFATGGTLMAWVRLADDGQAATGVIIDTSDDADAGYILSTLNASAGHVSVRFQRNWSASSGGIWTADLVTQPWTGSSDRAIHKGSWTSIAITYSDTAAGNQPTFYINGTVVSNTQNTAASGAAQSDAGNPITIGNIGTGLDRCLDGQIGVVLLWNRTLNPDEIQRAHSSFAPRYGVGFRGGDGRLIGSGGFADISGQDLWMRAGDSHSTTNSEAEGGHVYLIAGDHLGGGNAAAGRIYIKSGDGGGNVGGSSEILIETGTSGLGGALTIRQGTQNTTNTPDPLTIQGADNDGTGGAGAVFIRAGANVQAGDTAADVTVRAGDGDDNGGSAIFGGDAEFRAGDGVGRGGGSCTVRGGDGGSGNGGDMTMRAGDAQAGNARGGRVFIDSGDGSGSGSGSLGGGNIEITAGGNPSGSNITAGDVIITTGTNAGANFSGFGAGAFTVNTGSQTNSGAAANSPGGNATFTLGSSAKTSTSSPGGSFIVTCGAGVANSANSRGGSGSITGGNVTGTTAGAVAGSLTFTGGQATNAAGTSGSVTCTGGAVGSSGGTPGTFTGAGGAGLGSVGGDANLLGGDGDGSNAGGSANVTGGIGGATGAGGTAVVEGGTGGATSGAGGQARLKGGDAASGSNDDGGVALVRGGDADGSGTNGGVGLVTSDVDAGVGILTTGTSFQGTVHEHFTHGQQTSINPFSQVTLVTLGTLSANGQNMKIDVYVTGVDNSVDSSVSSFKSIETWCRFSGSLASLSSHLNSTSTVGSGFSVDVTYAVTTSGDNIILQITNNSPSVSYTGNFSISWNRQEGGFTS